MKTQPYTMPRTGLKVSVVGFVSGVGAKSFSGKVVLRLSWGCDNTS